MAGNIYVVRNRVNDKCYVGQTIHPVEKRLREHSHNKKSLLGRAIRKYGINNFAIATFENIREEWIDWAEQEMIINKKSLVPNGYNIHAGVQGS